MACVILWSRLKARTPHCGTTTLPRVESLSRWSSPKSSDNQVAIGCRFSWLNSGSRNSAKSLISRSWLDLSRAANQFLGSNLKTNHQVKKNIVLPKAGLTFWVCQEKHTPAMGLPTNLSHIDCGPMQCEPPCFTLLHVAIQDYLNLARICKVWY